MGEQEKRPAVESLVRKALTMPAVRIDREKFLTEVLSSYYAEDVVRDAVAANPASRTTSSA